jgi:uncharacterized membrane protein YebE (DUF533 family)
MKKIIAIGLIGFGIYWIYKCQKQKKAAFSTNPNDPQSQPYSITVSR